MYTEGKNLLRVETGREFKVYIAPNGILSEKEIFWDEYLMAARALNSIVKRHTESLDDSSDYQNNIIAFCGERGTGKTSAMLNFGNAIKNCENNHKLNFSDEVRKMNVVQNILVDPSVFDEIHSILDILVAEMYRKFSEVWRNHKIDREDMVTKKYDSIVCSFQKVYGELSLVNNSSKILDNEYDYDGNVGKLSRLGKSLNLKKDLHDLISNYLEFMVVLEGKNKSGNNVLLLEIDDIDLCSGNAYKMIEEIRKYLMLPNIIILMAVRLEQLELCIDEQNYKDFNTLFKINPKQVKNEVEQMTAKYLLKLIPEPRRILLSQKNIYDSELRVTLDDGKNIERVTDAICRMFYENTGVIVPQKEMQLFLPKELRGLINLLIFLEQMKKEGEEEKIYNVRSILNYTRNVLIKENLTFEKYKELLLRLIDLDANWLNYSVAELFLNKKDNVTMHQIINLSVKRANYEDYVAAVMIQYIYALKLSAERTSLEKNVNYDVWGECITNKLPEGKEEVIINTLDTFEIIGKSCGYELEGNWLEEGNSGKLVSKPTVLKKLEMQDEWLEVLLLFLAFLKSDENHTYISKTSASFINKEETIRLTNFVTNIQNLDRVVENSGILNLYGEETTAVMDAAERIKIKYKRTIEYLTKLYSNPLLGFYIQKAISEGKEYKEKADDQTRLEKQCERILQNIFTIPSEYGITDNKLEIHREFITDVSSMYAKVVCQKRARPVGQRGYDTEVFKLRMTGQKEEFGAIWDIKVRFRKNLINYSVLKERMETIAHNVAVRCTSIGKDSKAAVLEPYSEKFQEMIGFYAYINQQDMEVESRLEEREKYREYAEVVNQFLYETEPYKNGI